MKFIYLSSLEVSGVPLRGEPGNGGRQTRGLSKSQKTGSGQDPKINKDRDVPKVGRGQGCKIQLK
jgi:hypothetical protein